MLPIKLLDQTAGFDKIWIRSFVTGRPQRGKLAVNSHELREGLFGAISQLDGFATGTQRRLPVASLLLDYGQCPVHGGDIGQRLAEPGQLGAGLVQGLRSLLLIPPGQQQTLRPNEQ